MPRAPKPRAAKRAKPKAGKPDHWRVVAARHFPQHQDLISSDDEEYGLYNLFFQLLSGFTKAIAKNDTATATKILDFAGRCLRDELASDGEDISAAAGVSLFEHIFDDSPQRRWPRIFSAMSATLYSACRPYLQGWMEPRAFSKVDKDATIFYG
jgi:hypothetical protein